MKIIRETTTYSKVDYDVPCHDYLVESGRGGRLIAMRKQGSDRWEKFSKMIPFSTKHRTFKQLREDIPVEFDKPIMSDAWKNKSYNNLEMFM